jgi:hypothetical protein
VSAIEQRLRELRRELRGLSWRRRRRVLAEVEDHLRCAVDDGLSEAEAVADLGAPGVAFAGLPERRRPQRLSLIAGPLVLLALAPSLDGTLRQLGAGTTPSQAASPPTMTQAQQTLAQRRCVASWNAEATGRWRAAAVGARIQRADVAIIVATTFSAAGRATATRIRGCTVILQRALTASPYQSRIYVYGTPSGRSFRFVRELRGRIRSAAPATNARVDSAGRLALASHLVPAACPAAPIGSRVVSVQALPERRALLSRATTHLQAARPEAFVVAIRNVGHVAIHGAIASIDVSGPARPGRPWWRSGPRTVNRLDPGETVSLRFAPPALGHGVRLLRATSAAIACETRVADNSPVFRVDFG